MYSLNFNIKRLSLLILWGFIVFGLKAQHTEILNENDTTHRCELIHVQIRYTLSRLNYYTDAQRNVLHQGIVVSNNAPYIETLTKE